MRERANVQEKAGHRRWLNRIVAGSSWRPQRLKAVAQMKRFFFCLSIFVVSVLISGFSEKHFSNDSLIQNAFPCPDADIPRYNAKYTSRRPMIDGKLDEPLWKNAARSAPFRDLIRGTKTHHDTRAAVIWDEEYLYVAYWMEEPDVKAALTERDAPIYQDNDVELFIAGEDGYYEFEINAHATIYEVLFFWEDSFQRNGYAAMPEFNRNDSLARPFNGVGFKNHPRGKRIGFWSWDYPGLQSAVYVDGTLNDSTDKDKGWTVELALPWKGFDDDSGGWAWSPHGVWDSHVPECFTYVEWVR